MKSYEILKFLTVKLTASKAFDTKSESCIATGFYVILNGSPVIVTAKHFSDETELNVTITAHYKENGKIISLPVTAYVEWVISEEFDIAYCKVEPFEKKFKEITGLDMFYTALTERNIMTKEEFTQLSQDTNAFLTALHIVQRLSASDRFSYTSTTNDSSTVSK